MLFFRLYHDHVVVLPNSATRFINLLLIVVGIPLITLKKYLKRCTLLDLRAPYVIEHWVLEALPGRLPKLRVEFQATL